MRTFVLTVNNDRVVLCTILCACTLVYGGAQCDLLRYSTILYFKVMRWSVEAVDIIEARMNGTIFGTFKRLLHNRLGCLNKYTSSFLYGYECNHGLDLILIVH